MHGFEEAVAFAAAGEERDATWRSLAQDLADAAASRREGPGFIRASKPADLARALGPRRREAQGRQFRVPIGPR